MRLRMWSPTRRALAIARPRVHNRGLTSVRHPLFWVKWPAGGPGAGNPDLGAMRGHSLLITMTIRTDQAFSLEVADEH